MWLTLNMIWCTFSLISLLGLLRTGAPQNTTMDPVTDSTNSSTMPTSDETTSPPDDNPMCIDPQEKTPETMNGLHITEIADNFGSMWRDVSEFHPGFAGTCRREGSFSFIFALGGAAQVAGAQCPMIGEPYVPRFEKGPMVLNEPTGMIIVFGMDLQKLVDIGNSSWKTMDIMKNLPADKAKALVEKYEQGPWDPFFQVLWAREERIPDPTLNSIGCSVMEYTVNDTEALSKIFKMKIDQPTELWNLVCLRRPLGCTPGERAWVKGDCHTTTTTTEGTNNPPSTAQSSPQPTAPHPTTQAPHASGKRIGQGMGFNFGSITILMSTILSGNL
uniref:Chaperone protein DnaK n=1 Tax=Lygus hesperus TaxID=30085 RepID=A0A0A9X7B6_LYGHE